MTLIPADRKNGESPNCRLFPGNHSETHHFLVKALFCLFPKPNSYTKRQRKLVHYVKTTVFQVEWGLVLLRSPGFPFSNLQLIPLLLSDSDHCSHQQMVPKEFLPCCLHPERDMEGAFPQSTFKILSAADANSWKMHLPSQSGASYSQ